MRNSIRLVVLSGVFAMPGANIVDADVINVPAGHPTIQGAINAANPGDEVVVAPGTYSEIIDLLGKVITVRSSGGAGVTTIDATFVVDPGTGKPVIRCDSSEGPDTVIDGFTITGGTGSTNSAMFAGGGMYNDGSSPTVTDCIFLENAANIGGGMYNDNESNPKLIRCAFTGNSATEFGGGVANRGNSAPALTECSFDGNAALKGAGMYNDNASPVLDGCTFTANVASYFNGIIGEGGGMGNFGGSSPTVTDCTFSQNRSAGGSSRGGGMSNGYVSNPIVTNSAFIENSSRFGGGMFNYDSSPTVSRCSFNANRAANSVKGGGGSGMFNASNSAPRVTGCTFEGHTTGVSAMINDGSSPTVADCMFSTNIGSGMRNRNGSSPTVDGCRFVDNTGGGMYNFRGSSPTVKNCLFNRNLRAGNQRGGGMTNTEGSSPVVTHCAFIANASAGNGGGMSNFNDSSPTVANCTFNGNSALFWGGGMYNNWNSNPRVINCVFGGNTAVRGGGGVANTSNSAAAFWSCTFAANQAGDTGGGAMYNSNSDPTVANCILWGDIPDEVAGHASTPIIGRSDIEGGWPGGSNINDDPLFANADGPDGISGTADDDLRLLIGSPCIDAGLSRLLPVDTPDLDSNGVFTGAIPVDLDGHARVLCMEVDIGAYEFGIGDFDCDQVVTLTDFAEWQGCMTRPGKQSIQPTCEAFDFEFDVDVDLKDFALFMQQFVGPF